MVDPDDVGVYVCGTILKQSRLPSVKKLKMKRILSQLRKAL